MPQNVFIVDKSRLPGLSQLIAKPQMSDGFQASRTVFETQNPSPFQHDKTDAHLIGLRLAGGGALV